MKSQSYTIAFIKKQQIAPDTYSFYFARPKKFSFIAGQYNRWTLPFTATDGRGSSRFFTIASSPSEKEFLIVTTKIIRSDFKKELINLKKGDQIKIFGPMGIFFLDNKNSNEHIFLSEGLGITPYYSIIKDESIKKGNETLTLIASFPTSDEMIFSDELTKISKTNLRINIIYNISKKRTSYISLIKNTVKDISHCLFYITGSPEMVEETQKLLKEINISDKQILTEQFSGY